MTSIESKIRNKRVFLCVFDIKLLFLKVDDNEAYVHCFHKKETQTNL